MPLTMKRFAWLLALTMFLVGCDATKPNVSGQVIARVNGEEISIHQLNRLIGQQGEISETQRRDLIERLVERELAAQQALALELDRQPEVMLRLEEARRDALAAAWADHLAASHSPPEQNESARYFAEHPGLFAERKLYRLRELTLPSESPLVAEMENRLKQGQPIQEIRAWLQGQGIRFTEQTIMRLAEQLPIEAVDRLREATAGQIVAFRSPRALTVYQVLTAEAHPVDWASAEPVIKAYLATQARNQRLVGEMRRLRSQAHIEYQGGADAP